MIPDTDAYIAGYPFLFFGRNTSGLPAMPVPALVESLSLFFAAGISLLLMRAGRTALKKAMPFLL